MESPAQTGARLVAALEELVAQEAATLAARDFGLVAQLQAQAAPLVEHLAAHAADVADPALRERLRTLLSRREQTGAWLAGQLEQTRLALAQMDESRRRVAQVAPAYGARATTESSRQLCVVG